MVMQYYWVCTVEACRHRHLAFMSRELMWQHLVGMHDVEHVCGVVYADDESWPAQQMQWDDSRPAPFKELTLPPKTPRTRSRSPRMRQAVWTSADPATSADTRRVLTPVPRRGSPEPRRGSGASALQLAPAVMQMEPQEFFSLFRMMFCELEAKVMRAEAEMRTQPQTSRMGT